MPMAYTKTHKNYRWIVPEALEPVMKVIMKMKKRGYTRPESLANYLGEYLLTQFVPYAGTKPRDSSGKLLNLRRIRATIAT